MVSPIKPIRVAIARIKESFGISLKTKNLIGQTIRNHATGLDNVPI